MPTSLETLLGRMDRGETPAIVALLGAEHLLRIEAASRVREAAGRQGYAEREVFDAGAGFDWADFEASLNAPSLFSKRRIIELRLPNGRAGRQGGASLEAIAKSPPADVLLLLIGDDWSRRHEAAWSKAVEKHGAVTVFWPLAASAVPRFIEARLAGHGLTAAADAIALLAERSEGHLLAAAQEIDKLALLAKSRTTAGPIALAELEAVIADSARFDVFALVDSALAGDGARALRIARAMRLEGEQVPGLLPWLSSQLKLLASATEAATVGGINQAVARMRLPRSREAAMQSALRRHNLQSVGDLVDRAGRVERLGKGRGRGDAWLEFERLLAALAGKRLDDGLAAESSVVSAS